MFLGEDCPFDPFVEYTKKLNMAEKLYHGKQFEGNDCKKFISIYNLKILNHLLKKAYFPKSLRHKFITVLTDIRVIYNNSCGLELYSDYKSDIRNFKNSWEALVEDDFAKDTEEYRLSWINKVHFMVDHFQELLEVEKTGLGQNSDQNIECMHSFTYREMKRGGYWTIVSTSDRCGEKQHEGVLKINAYSVKLEE